MSPPKLLAFLHHGEVLDNGVKIEMGFLETHPAAAVNLQGDTGR